MAVLSDILYKVSLIAIQGNSNATVTAITIDSRKVVAGGLYAAIAGVTVDGHHYIDAAIANGASVIVCNHLPQGMQAHVTYVQVADTAIAIAHIAHQFYGRPSEKVKLVGVTGTNGKTTIATLLYKLFANLGCQCGLISTVQNHIGNAVVPSTHTTPDAVALNALLASMVEAGCTYVFMECSSHAIHQHRIAGLRFEGAVFSNITHDHLDYHRTFEEYIRVKKLFFDGLTADAFAISNADDKRGSVMLQNTAAKKMYYGLKNAATFKGKILDNALTGLHMLVNEQEVHFRMIGEFNAYNLLAVYGAAVSMQQSPAEVLRVLSMLTGAEGRFDYSISKSGIIAIVDYAHTPDALENVLTTIKKLRKGYERIITVVGCGGDRDTTKRPIMAQSACDLSDHVILTSDNPRTEKPEAILNDMQQGLSSAAKRKYQVVVERDAAIATAVTLAMPEDIILIAGKGHEKYQEIMGVKHPFDDKLIVQQAFQQQNK